MPDTKQKELSNSTTCPNTIFRDDRTVSTANKPCRQHRLFSFKTTLLMLGKRELFGTLRFSTAYLLILLFVLQSNIVVAASSDRGLRSNFQLSAISFLEKNDPTADPEPDFVNRATSWLFRKASLSVSETSLAESITAFGSKRLHRTNGAPNNYVETFSMPPNCANGTYTLKILNGESNGTNRISSAVIKLNGTEVFLQSEFNQNVYTLEKSVTLLAQNTLEIRLASTPGSYLSIKVSGENCGSSDNVPPQIVISSPLDNTATTNATIGLSGTAADFGANASGVAQVLVNDVAVSYNATAKTWSLTGASLAVGMNIFTAKAIDVAGNESTSQVTVIRDLTNPAISVVSPSNNAITLAETIAVSGNAFDTGADASGIASVKVNGIEAVFDSLNGNWSLSSASLNVGDNTFTAVACDRAGNQANSQIVVRRVVNQPPTANAGSDLTIELPNTASLAGNTSDDGYPIGSSVSVAWNKVSGNGAVVFANPNSLQTSASFSSSGIYVVRLTASDGSLSASDDLTITVHPENQAPTVNAGADRTIQLPNNVALLGTVADDGYPVSSALSAQWSKFSGLGNVTFSTPTNQQTEASFSQAGNYILRLSVTDGQYTVFDDLSVVVSAANQAPVADFSVPSAGGPMGMNVVSFSSASPDNSPSKLLDESTFSTWITANTQPNQFATFELTGGEQLIQSFRFQQANFPTSYMVKDFIVQVSTTASDDASFSTVLAGTFQANTQLQEVYLPTGAVHARFVKLIAVNTHGSPSPIAVSTFQVIGAGMADSIVSLPGTLNAAKRTSPSFLTNGAAISRFSSFQVSGPGGHPVGLITDSGTWLTTSKVNEFVVIKLGGDGSHSLKGIRLGGNYNAGINYWVKDFEIWISNTVDDDAAYTKVLDGVKTTSETQDYIFPGGPVPARYIKYVPKSNRDGSTSYIANMAIEAIALDGAGIHSFSSDYENSRVEEAFDNNPQSGWYCAPGALTNQWVKVRLDGTGSQRIYGVRIGGSNSSFGNFGPRDYQIRISNTTADDAAFTTIDTGTLSTSPAMQEIRFAQPADAKYVQFYWVNGHSASSWLSVYELEVLSLAKDGATLTGISSQGDMTVPAARVLDLDQGTSYSQWYSVSGQNTNQNLTLRLYIKSHTYGLDLISQRIVGGAVSFYCYDGHGSVRNLTNGVGTVTDSYNFDAFGNLIYQAGTTNNSYLFAGEQFDADLRLYYNRARYLDVQTGRFISHDTYEGNQFEPISLHKYLYANADPVNKLDPTGKFSVSELVETVKTYMVLAAIHFPRLTKAIVFTAEALTPIELTASLPSFGLSSGLGALAMYGAAKELPLMRRTFLERGMYAGLGLQFEEWVGQLLKIPADYSQIIVKDGKAIGSRVLGSAVVDYIYRGSILEVKGTGAAAMVKEAQTKELAKFAERQTLGLTYVFLNRPSQAQMETIRTWVREVAPSVEPVFQYVFP
ncbi:MAG: discoidin domain-containing protein [Pyrinomonadaceae bacterium]